MPAKFTVDIDDAELKAGLARIAQRAGALQPALRDIGELLVKTTKDRFRQGAGPDGARQGRFGRRFIPACAGNALTVSP